MVRAIAAMFLILCGTVAHAESDVAERLLLARDHKGVLYVGYAEEGRVAARYEDSSQTDLATGLGKLAGIAVDDARNVYVSSVSHGVVYCIDRQGMLSEAVRNIEGAGDIALTRDGDVVLVTREGVRTFSKAGQ
ncbi:NHL repeat-containing protein [Halodesulfovibrio spirochaetisodalis]|uniref:Uncharacterized protein n=1 Tax=Halodesulfovibrio spirochaetisodalis TaxID=1560234 RepID=A0A1B7XMK2_9BACT|nr:hypothetical protein [Halodesulfovibrio spirochaetisodalis]OBQ56750.1 hypothetical protein SP90_01300 [Halodesulfovibrio spirochaetisodalis]